MADLQKKVLTCDNSPPRINTGELRSSLLGAKYAHLTFRRDTLSLGANYAHWDVRCWRKLGQSG